MSYLSRTSHPIVMSNKLLPIELDIAISPNPFLATITDVSRSGTLVPAASTVNPIICHTKLILSIVYTAIFYGVGCLPMKKGSITPKTNQC